MRCDNRVEVIARHCAINSGAGRACRVIPSRNVSRIIWITGKLVSYFENLLSIINEFLRAMRIVERDEIGQCPHTCLAQSS